MEKPASTPAQRTIVYAGLGYLWYQSATVNYAQEVAKPLENAPVKAGAVKCKTVGDAGRGPDNRTPWYKGYLSMPLSSQEALVLLQNTTANNGYSLTHASASNRGPVDVADQFVEEWYYDDYTKDSPYSALGQGKIVLKATLDEDGAANACENAKGVNDTNTIVSISVRLPNYK